MRPSSAAALCAAALALASPARAHDRVSDVPPQPVSRTVLVPPAVQPAPPVVEPAAVPPALPGEPGYTPPPGMVTEPTQPRRGPGSELGFQLRVGAADSDRLLVGTSLAGSSGVLTVGFSADTIVDVEGTTRHFADNGGGWYGNWCIERPDGRCTSRVDVALSGFAGLRLRSDPSAGGVRLRLDLLGELGWQWTGVNERITGTGGATWEDASRAYTFGGVRAGLGLTVFRHTTFGFGAFARQGLGDKACLGTNGRCTWVGGRQTGVFMFVGGDWGGN